VSLATPIDVVVPVFGAADDTTACLASVLGSTSGVRFEVVVVDDASPDPVLAAHLDELATRGRITLLRNEANVGFVVSCDRGMALHPDRDVVLLNSDTLVFDGWLDRLCGAAAQDPTIGTITPLSNDATLCNYPVPFALETAMDPAEARVLDELAAEVNAGTVVDLPTGVGFCMFVRRALLDAIGGFDLERFGRGYGEEIDLCLRGEAGGWRNVAAADPLDEARARLDEARLRRGCCNGAELVVLHDLGGGTEVFAQHVIAELRAEGRQVLVGRPDGIDRSVMRLEWVDGPPTPNLRIALLGRSPEEIGAVFRRIGVQTARVEQVAGYPEQTPAVLAEAFAAAAIPYLVTLHDHAAICPRIHLTTGSGTYCGEPGPAVCQACVNSYGGPWGSVSIPEWRGRFGLLLRGAERVEAPSRRLAERVGGLLGVKVHVRDPPPIPRAGLPAPIAAVAALPTVVQGRLRVGVIGLIGEVKGFAHLFDVARFTHENALPIDILVFGDTADNDAFVEMSGVTITGRYHDDHVDDLVRAARLDVIWFPGAGPETWSYVLDIALDSGLPIVAFRIGAIAERLVAVPNATLLPIGDAFRPDRVIDALARAAGKASLPTTMQP